jgi:hypothetical protein
MGIKDELKDRADEAAEHAAFEQGGYPGLIKFKMFMFYNKTKDVCCCA